MELNRKGNDEATKDRETRSRQNVRFNTTEGCTKMLKEMDVKEKDPTKSSEAGAKGTKKGDGGGRSNQFSPTVGLLWKLPSK